MEPGNRFAANITADEIKELELRAFQGRIVVVDNMQSFYPAIQLLKNSKVLGFDTETRPSFRKGKKNRVSLLQL